MTRQKDYSRKQRIKRSILRRQLKEDCIKIMGGKCNVCGYNSYIEAMDFHHVNPESKEHGISLLLNKAIMNNNLLVVLRKEIEKCILLCSNCHSELHAKLEKDKLEKDKIYSEYISSKRYNVCLPKITT